MTTKKATPKAQPKKQPSAKAQELAAQLKAKNDALELEAELIEVDLSDLEVEPAPEKKSKAPSKKAQSKAPIKKATDNNGKGKTSGKAAPVEKKVEDDTPEEGLLTTKEVARMVGTTPKELRRVLRAKWYNDKVTTHYRWTEDDPVLKEIVDFYAAKKVEAKAAK